MSTPSPSPYLKYRVGDRLRVLKNTPWGAGFYKGDIIVVLREGSTNSHGKISYRARRADIPDSVVWLIGNDRHGIALEYAHGPNDLEYYTEG